MIKTTLSINKDYIFVSDTPVRFVERLLGVELVAFVRIKRSGGDTSPRSPVVIFRSVDKYVLPKGIKGAVRYLEGIDDFPPLPSHGRFAI